MSYAVLQREWLHGMLRCQQRRMTRHRPVESSALEEVVVTAQKREENLQDELISITVVSGERIQNRSIEGLEGLNA